MMHIHSGSSEFPSSAESSEMRDRFCSHASLRTNSIYPDTVYDRMSLMDSPRLQYLYSHLERPEPIRSVPVMRLSRQEMNVKTLSSNPRRRLESVVSQSLHNQDSAEPEIGKDIAESEDPVYLDIETHRCQRSDQITNTATLDEMRKLTLNVVAPENPINIPFAPRPWASYSVTGSWIAPQRDSRRESFSSNLEIETLIRTSNLILEPMTERSETDETETDEFDLIHMATIKKKVREPEMLHPHNCTPCRFYCFSLKHQCQKGDDCGFCHLDHTSKRLEKKLQSLKSRRNRNVIRKA